MIDQQTISEILKHITILNDDYTKLAMDVAVLKSQVADLIWYFRAVMGGLIVLVVTQFWQVIIMKKNNNKKS